MTKTTMTKAQFARHINKTRQYVTQLVKNGRTVQNDAGLIIVAETMALIDDTSDPSKVGVVERQQQRCYLDIPDAEITAADLKPIGNIPAFQESKAKKEYFLAQKVEQEFKQSQGELLVAEEVKAAVMQSDSIIRNKLESMPMMLAPMLAAENDIQRIESMIAEFIEHTLTELSVSFRKMAHA